MCFTAGAGRSHFEHRAALVANSVHETRLLLEDLVANRRGPVCSRGGVHRPADDCLVVPGQGSQYPGMARELFDSEPVFADTVRRCAEAVDPILPRPLLDVLLSGDRQAVETFAAHILCAARDFAVEMGLACWPGSRGHRARRGAGHSVGQYAAACVAGVFSLGDGARLIAERGRLFGSLPAGGRMVAVFADPEYVLKAAENFPAFPSARTTAATRCSRDPVRDLEQIVAACSHDGTRCTWLETSHAFHSGCSTRCSTNSVLRGAIHLCGSGTAAGLQTGPASCSPPRPAERELLAQAFPPARAVRRGVATVANLGCSGADGDRSATDPDRRRVADLARVGGRADDHRLAAQGRQRSASDDQKRLPRRTSADTVRTSPPGSNSTGPWLELPTYPFQRRRFWPRPPVSGPTVRPRPVCSPVRKDLASGDTVYSTVLSVKTQPWLAHHVIYGTVVVRVRPTPPWHWPQPVLRRG